MNLVAPFIRRPVMTTLFLLSLLAAGFFTLLMNCYLPTCTRDQLCYSIACPRRLEQQARLNMKPQPGLRLKKEISRESLGDLVVRVSLSRYVPSAWGLGLWHL